ncbi:MAG: glycosyltransferase [Actinobacteria bacterium]|nr:glycosyltransferase [Actinomycetota bacterium]
MKILIIAMSNSIHTARWISHINDEKWDIILFPVNMLVATHPDIKNIKVYTPKIIQSFANLYKINKKKNFLNLEMDLYPFTNKKRSLNLIVSDLFKLIIPDIRLKKLIRLIKKFKPDIIHSMHIQEAGYLALEAKKRMKGCFPKWLVTNWGSELNLFVKLKSHESKIIEVLKNCDYFSSECKRDLPIARKYGFKGKFLNVIPNSGGLDFNYIEKLKKEAKTTSERKIIMLKGYQGWAGRALVGLRALERNINYLDGFKVIIFCIDTIEVRISAELFSKNTGIEIKIIEKEVPHEEILKYHGQARISIGLSITDAISTSMLEAMLMGSFPIQSYTSCADEWVEHNKTAFLVHPEDTDEIANAIRIALTDDELVNNAAKVNYENLKNRLEKSKIKEIIVNQYLDMLS